VGAAGTVKFEARIKELVENLPDLAELVEPLLIVRWTLREQIGILHRRLLAIVRNDEVCRRLMTVPGVTDLSRYRRRTRAIPKLQGSRGGVWADPFQDTAAIVALARRLAVIMRRIWVDGTEFRWTREVTAA
jgi:hypothetical protein